MKERKKIGRGEDDEVEEEEEEEEEGEGAADNKRCKERRTVELSIAAVGGKTLPSPPSSAALQESGSANDDDETSDESPRCPHLLFLVVAATGLEERNLNVKDVAG